MAMVRPARSTPPYALIIFIFLWIVSTALAAVIYVQAGKQIEESKAEASELNAIASKPERTLLVKTLQESAKADSKVKRTALGEAMRQVDALKSKIGGEGSVDDMVKLNGIIDQAIHQPILKSTETEVGPTSLLAALKQATQLAASQKEQIESLEADKKLLAADYEKAKREKDAQLLSAKTQASDRSTELSKRDAQITSLHAELDNVTKTQAEKNAESQRQQEVELRKLVAQIKEAEDAKVSLQSELDKAKNELRGYKGGPKYAFGVDPVGKLIRVNNNDNEVWINLGRKDHITPGMTFAVYDPRVGASTSAENKGKRGDIEVIEVGDVESLARITHTEKTQALLQNDIISNPVYSRDKNRKFHFIISGNFDIDADGVPTPGEREKIVRLVQSWGGVIDDKVTSQTDFLIVGSEPSSMASKVDTESEQGQDLIKQSQDQAKAYADRLVAARELSIPILNANRFLSMIGYYNPTVTKY